MFNYDWFHGPAYDQQCQEARERCARRHFSNSGDAGPDASADADAKRSDESAEAFSSELETRTLIYLRDGFSYEIRDIADVGSKSHLVFECEPVDDQYKVGAFVVTVPFDEIVRVEVFAVHPSEKPQDSPQITGFRGHPDAPEHRYDTKPAVPGR